MCGEEEERKKQEYAGGILLKPDQAFSSSRGTESSLFQAAATTALNEQLGRGGSAAGTLLPLHVLVRASQSQSFLLGCLVLAVSVYQTNLRLFSTAAHRRKKKKIHYT